MVFQALFILVLLKGSNIDMDFFEKIEVNFPLLIDVLDYKWFKQNIYSFLEDLIAKNLSHSQIIRDSSYKDTPHPILSFLFISYFLESYPENIYINYIIKSNIEELFMIEKSLNLIGNRISKDDLYSYRNELQNPDQWDDILSEIYFVAQFSSIADKLEIHVPTSNTSPKNFDFKLELQGLILNGDVKLRKKEIEMVSETFEKDVKDLIKIPSGYHVELNKFPVKRRFYEEAIKIALFVEECFKIYQEHPNNPDICYNISGIETTWYNNGFYVQNDDLISYLDFEENEKFKNISCVSVEPTVDRHALEELPSVASNSTRCTVNNPESTKIRDILRKTLKQLPSSPYNIIVLASKDNLIFIDFLSALYGDEIIKGNSKTRHYFLTRCNNGVFDEEDFNNISGALLFNIKTFKGQMALNHKALNKIPDKILKIFQEAFLIDEFIQNGDFFPSYKSEVEEYC